MDNIIEKAKEIWTIASDKIWEISDSICSKIGIDTLTGIMIAAIVLLVLLFIILISGSVKRRNRVKAGLPANGKIKYSDINWEFDGQGSMKAKEELALEASDEVSEATAETPEEDSLPEAEESECTEESALDAEPAGEEIDEEIPEEEIEGASEDVPEDISEDDETLSEDAEDESALEESEEESLPEELGEAEEEESILEEAEDAIEDIPEETEEIEAEKISQMRAPGFKKFGPENRNTSRSGRVYTEEELRQQIRE